MSDTAQVVCWSLEFICPLRTVESAGDPDKALGEISRARSQSLRTLSPEAGSSGDVCVTGYELLKVPKGLGPACSTGTRAADSASGMLSKLLADQDSERASFPSRGFVISEEFAKVGGLAGLRTMCQSCPANALRPDPAGCAGTLYLPPETNETRGQLSNALSRLNLKREVTDVFLKTNPLWYGLWSRSPLSQRASEILEAVASDLAAQYSPAARLENPSYAGRAYHDLRAFVRAIETARQQCLRLHVSMAPPGHTDFGFYTVFAHCPRCKAEANLKRWQRRYPTELYTCQVCGQQYSPAATASRKKDGFDFKSLRQILGAARFADFAKSYLIARGFTAVNALKVIEAADASELYVQKKAAESKIMNARRERFIQENIYAGLHATHLRNSEDHGENQLFFRADEFAELLRRCGKRGVNVVFMFHESTDELICLSAMNCKTDALRVFEDWRAKGCNEWFGAVLGVPDNVLEQSAGGA